MNDVTADKHSAFCYSFSMLILAAVFLFSGCSTTTLPKRDLASFSQPSACYDRQLEPSTPVVDSHIHFRAFGGKSIPFTEINDYFRQTTIRFANIYGIGQVLPADSSCTYYLDCPGTPVLPSIKNDMVNAANYVEFPSEDIQLVLSMTFPDMAKLEDVQEIIELYDKEYPGLFKWAGEINLVKQALLQNGHVPVTKADINKWGAFMELLRQRNIPINFHSDLGNDENPTKYLGIMEYVLQQYPANKIVWAHMGLSKELAHMDATRHTKLMARLLNTYPNLMLDISWNVLNTHYFSKPAIRAVYVDFFNTYSERILPGTDFVASRNKSFEVYEKELGETSSILQDVDDTAFRNIALGENYFRFLSLNYQAPDICQ